MKAFLAANGDVLGKAQTASLAFMQGRVPAITTEIASAPERLFRLGGAALDQPDGYYHRKTSGDGSLLAHYTLRLDLDSYKAKAKTDLARGVSPAIATGFSQEQVASLSALYSKASIEGGLPNRLAYIKTGLDWMEFALAEYSSRSATIDAAVDQAGVDAVATGWDAWLAANVPPTVTVAGAMAVTD